MGEIPGTVDVVEDARTLASLPMRMGGLGLRSAERCAHAAHWASWADALHMIAQRNPAVAEMVVQSMSDDINPGEGSLAELKMATDRLDRQGFWWDQVGQNFKKGADQKRTQMVNQERWQHGWQYWSSSVSDSHFRAAQLFEGLTYVPTLGGMREQL